jgi:hypothetical protein
MLEIRPLLWLEYGWRRRFNPLRWKSNREQVRIAGGIADWLHNLAIYSALNFDHFDEDWFWKDYQWLLDQHPTAGLERYRAEFDKQSMSSGGA